MVNQTKSLHHIHKRKRVTEETELIRKYDNFIYIVVILAPITNLPQFLKVWLDKDATGVSPLSWFMFSAISITWLFYGILHKDRHILLMNAALMTMQVLIAVGAIIYG